MPLGPPYAAPRSAVVQGVKYHMKELSIVVLSLLTGCASITQDSPSVWYLGSWVKTDIYRLIEEGGVDCGGSWGADYWWSGVRKMREEIERNNRKALSCVQRAKESERPFIYRYTYEIFNVGSTNYIYVSSNDGRNILIISSGGDVEGAQRYFASYLGYCENIVVDKDGSMSYKCSDAMDISLLNKIRVQ